MDKNLNNIRMMKNNYFMNSVENIILINQILEIKNIIRSYRKKNSSNYDNSIILQK